MSWLEENSIDLFYVENDGLDFGMWQKSLRKFSAQEYDTLCLCNDSCILFRPLDEVFKFSRENNHPALGLVKSYEFSEHLQSYFMIFRGEAKKIAIDYILSLDLTAKKYDEIVELGELGLSTHLINKSIPLYGRFEPTTSTNENPSFIYCEQIIKSGMPMIKRKALGYPPGYLLKKYILAGKGTPRNYFIEQIKSITNEDVKIISFFEDTKKMKIRSEIKMMRRIIRFSFIKFFRKGGGVKTTAHE
jgi:lipopolysaccharide biosynthesis protein